MGTFDGKGYTISGIYMPLVQNTDTVDSALFGRLSGATIKNIIITDSYLYGSSKYKSSEVYVEQLINASDGNMRRLVHLLDLAMNESFKRHSGKDKVPFNDVITALKRQGESLESKVSEKTKCY